MGTTTDQLLKAALFDASEPESQTSQFWTSALRYMNEVYMDVCMGGGRFGLPRPMPWFWLMKDSNFILREEKTGTAAVTNGSASITFSSAISESVAGWHFFVENDSSHVLYKISSHTAGSAPATLDSTYIGATDASASYVLKKLDYSLPSDLHRIIEPVRLNGSIPASVSYLDNVEFHSRMHNWLMTKGASSIPQYFTVIDNTTIRFDGVGKEEVRVDFRYIQVPTQLTGATGEEPLIPEQYRSILSNGTTYWLLLSKNDDRAVIYGNMVKSKLMGMAEQNTRALLDMGIGLRRKSKIRSHYMFSNLR